MNICILKGQDPRHIYFAKKVAGLSTNECLILTHRRTNKSRLLNMLIKSPATFLNRVSKYIFYYFLKWNQREKDYFKVNKIQNEVVVENYNSDVTFNLINDFTPDLIVVFGTPIISNRIIKLPKFGAINLHGGISPEYKGGNTIFWALYNGEVDKAGATIHYMVEKVDSGTILAKVYPDINSTDDEFTVSAKTFQIATEEVCRIIEKIEKEKSILEGLPQSSQGRLYLAKDRTIFKDIGGFFKIKKNLSNISLASRVERFYE